ncbi:nanos homolog 1-like, partial [Anneissia japonica]|uniref:nanos homolog 1-like n=1 Tax=Anneissia japonica TaxID=1529436 RepID=UPI0014255AD3
MNFEDRYFLPMKDYLGLNALVMSMLEPWKPADGEPVSDPVRFDFPRNGVDCEIHPVLFDGWIDLEVCNDMASEAVGKQPSGRNKKARQRFTPSWCVFCKNNGEMESVYVSHVFKGVDGKVACPILR